MKTCRRGLHQFEGVRCLECKRDHNRILMKEWRKENLNVARERERQRRAINPEKLREQSRLAGRRWRAAHPEQSKAKSLACKWAHIDQRRATTDKHRQANLGLYAEASRRRRARKLNVTVAPISPDSLGMLLHVQEGRCYYCRALLGSDKHLEHRTPLVRGGAHAIDNACWSCPSCNRRKGTKTEQEFLALTAPNLARVLEMSA